MDDKDSKSEKKEIQIFVTEEDKHGSEITKMSDFFGMYVSDIVDDLNGSASLETVTNMPVADLGIINEVLAKAKAIQSGGVDLIPDYDSLPKKIRDGLADGTYKLGESRQNEGNVRAVIVDSEGTRVKDITFKQVHKDSHSVDATRSITEQLQMRQIYKKLEDIEELQNYQIEAMREQDIIVPFLSARDFVVRAQSTGVFSKQEELLEKATEKISDASNAVYIEIKRISDELVKLTTFPMLKQPNRIKPLIADVAQDLQIATKYVGVQMHILDYLGEKEGAAQTLETYQKAMENFFFEPINRSGLSTSDLIHNYIPDPHDSWLNLSEEIKPVVEKNFDEIENKDTYLISVED